MRRAASVCSVRSRTERTWPSMWVTSSSVGLTRDGSPLTEGADYTLQYDAARNEDEVRIGLANPRYV